MCYCYDVINQFNMIEKIIEKNDGLRRLDHFVKTHYKLTPKSHIYRMIRKGYIRVNGKKSKVCVRLQPGDIVVMPEPEKMEKGSVVLSTQRKEYLRSQILKETEDWLVVNKPDNRPVHAGTGHVCGLVDDYSNVLDQTVYLVHRLDRQTSGVMILAKNMRSKLAFDEMFKSRQLLKQYEMVTSRPDSEWQSLKCGQPLERVVTADGSRSRVSPDGLVAESVFTTVAQSGVYQRVQAVTKTGRFHQLRAHLSYLGHPILGDPWYEGEKSPLGLYLHASKIEFDWGGQEHCVSADWPDHKLVWMRERGLYEG